MQCNRPIKLLCVILSCLLCLPLLFACDGDSPSGQLPGTSSEQSTTEPTTETPTTEEVTTEEVTTEQTTTEQPTEAPTTEEATTQPPEPELLCSIDFSALSADLDLSDYFVQSHQCKVSLEQTEQDGQVLAFTTKSITNPGSSDPYVYFKHEQLVTDLGFEAVDTCEYPYLVLRVRSKGLTGATFSCYGYPSNSTSTTSLTGRLDLRLQRTEDWQYIWIDLSKYSKNIPLFRLDMANMAGANGEVLYISDMTFYADPEQALALRPAQTYPINEQTAENYVAKIMSFNVQTENGTQVRADIRADMLRDLLDEYMPDSIGMQEVTSLWRSSMNKYIFNASYASVGDPRTTGGEANPIYYRVDKFELVDSGTFWLSDTPDVQGSYLEGCLYPRICTWAHLRDRVTGKEYVHFNTHLDHLGGSDGRALRKQQIIVILKFAQRFGDIPMVLTGDLNQAAVNAEGTQYSVYKTLTGIKTFTLDDGTTAKSPFSNARYDAPDNMPEGVCATMTQYYDQDSTKYNPAKEPIDYVLYTKASLTALSYKIRLYDRCGLYLSDHLPVICEISFTPSPEAE